LIRFFRNRPEKPKSARFTHVVWCSSCPACEPTLEEINSNTLKLQWQMYRNVDI